MSSPGMRLAELVASLSMAVDLTVGQPMEHGLRAAILSVQLGELVGLDSTHLRDLYYTALLRNVGCIAHSNTWLSAFESDADALAGLAQLDSANPVAVLSFLMKSISRDEALPARLIAVAKAAATMPRRMVENVQGYCESGQVLSQHLGVGARVGKALQHMFERWDGKGLPSHVRGDNIDVIARIVQIAWDAQFFYRLGGTAAVRQILSQRAGSMYDPDICHILSNGPEKLIVHQAGGDTWQGALDAEPRPFLCVTDSQFDEVVQAFGLFADLRSRFTGGHSRRVAMLASGAATRLGLSTLDVTKLRMAGFVHDIGRVSVPLRVWEKADKLSPHEWEQVRLYPYYTERILARSPLLAPVGSLAAMHREHLDGSGYYKGATAAAIPMSARVLTVADVFQSMSEDRPYRPALTPEASAQALRTMASGGKLDPDAVRAILTMSERRVGPAQRERKSVLTRREVDVLKLVAQGLSNRDIAQKCFISPKTVDHHIQHIYSKIGVATRVGAALYAQQHGLTQNDEDAVLP